MASYELVERVLSSNLPQYLDRMKNAVNETVSQTIGLEAGLFQKIRKTYDGGTTCKEKLQFNRAAVGQWAAMDQKITMGGTRGPSQNEVAMRRLHSAHFIAFDEVDAQGDEKTVINNIVSQAKEDVDLFHLSMIRDAFHSRDGNYAHDGSSNFLAPYGWRHLLTIDGLHVTGSAVTNILGINASTQSLYRNPYINPVAASDGGKPWTSMTQIRNVFDRAFRMLHYTGVGAWGTVTKNVKGVPDTPLIRKTNAGPDYVILCDGVMHDDFGGIVFDRMDNVGADQGFPVRVYKGVPILWSEGLGMNSSGYGYMNDGTAAWADRGGSYASGSWQNYSEAVLLYLPEWRFWSTSQRSPKIFPPYKPELMAGLCYETEYRCALSVRSRRRCGVYMGPVPNSGQA